MKNALDLTPEDREFQSFSSWYFFLRVGFRFLFIMYVFENVCSFVFSFFILTFEQCLKLWQKRNCNAKQNSLRWNAENKILIKERFSKFNCYISEKKCAGSVISLHWRQYSNFLELYIYAGVLHFSFSRISKLAYHALINKTYTKRFRGRQFRGNYPRYFL